MKPGIASIVAFLMACLPVGFPYAETPTHNGLRAAQTMLKVKDLRDDLSLMLKPKRTDAVGLKGEADLALSFPPPPERGNPYIGGIVLLLGLE